MDKNHISRIKEIIIAAGKIAIELRNHGLDVGTKADGSPVTNADVRISDYIFAELSKIMPSVPIICEERELVDISDKRRFWLIDPIDGTRSFIKKQQCFTVNIALIEDNLPTYGFVYLPANGRLYFTDENKKLCIEEEGRIIPGNHHNDSGYVAVVSSNNLNPLTSAYLQDQNFAEVIIIPSSIKLCFVAEGAGDVHPKFGPTMEWDTAAGHALIKAAGGLLSDTSNRELLYAKEGFFNPHFIAANKRWLNK